MTMTVGMQITIIITWLYSQELPVKMEIETQSQTQMPIQTQSNAIKKASMRNTKQEPCIVIQSLPNISLNNNKNIENNNIHNIEYESKNPEIMSEKYEKTQIENKINTDKNRPNNDNH